MEKKTKYRYTSAIIFLIIALGGIALAMPLFRQHTKNPEINITAKFENENFIRALDEKGEKFARCDGKMIAAVVPHHMIGGQFIADVFSQAKDVDTVVVIGPNHYEKGDADIITSDSDWITAKGKVQINERIVRGLVSQKIAMAQNEVIGNDHSIGNILPFIAYYLPATKAVPVILKKGVPEDKLENFLRYIADQEKSTHMLIVGSVDFSHYLSAQEADKKDAETINAIENKDYGTISSFGNDHMDSPPTVKALLKITDMIGADKMIWRNSNSFKVLKNDINNTTSYFELVFCKNDQ